MRAYERLFKYIQFDTASCESSETCPSTEKQLVLGRALVEEMTEMGISGARIDENGYVYGFIPANAEGYPSIGLIAHMDTVDCVPTAPMNARIVENYDGEKLKLEGGDYLDPAEFPELKDHAGQDLIVTDGKTLLGADDKAGIAEILTACEKLLASDRPHGKICIGITPDEEIGRGADRFDIPGFGADFAYTVDGDTVGGIEYENFNAASASLTFKGKEKDRIFKYIDEGDFVYFVHSFCGVGCEDFLIATTEYGAEITAAVSNGNIYGMQFHPEKSGAVGMKILKAFCEL